MYIGSPVYDDKQRDIDRVRWNQRLVSELLEMRNTPVWPQARGPVTFEFRVVESEDEREGEGGRQVGRVVAREWIEAWRGGWSEVGEEEGMRRREGIV